MNIEDLEHWEMSVYHAKRVKYKSNKIKTHLFKHDKKTSQPTTVQSKVLCENQMK